MSDSLSRWAKNNIPCQNACPLGIDVAGFIHFIKNGELEKAYQLIKSKNPFPSFTGRLCYHPCEKYCKWNYISYPIAVKSLERFIADQNFLKNFEPAYKAIPGQTSENKGILSRFKIAVIGGGPLGVLLSHKLSVMGAHIDLYEARNELGGRLHHIPDSILSKEIIDLEIESVLNPNIHVKLKHNIQEETFQKDILPNYDAIYLATGNPSFSSVNLKGKEKSPIYIGEDFIKRSFAGEYLDVGDKVIILGGSDIAFWCARIAVQMGVPHVSIYYKGSKNVLLCSHDNFVQSQRKGINVHYLATGIEVLGATSVEQIKFQKMKMNMTDENTFVSVSPIENEYFNEKADTLIVCEPENLEFDETELDNSLYHIKEDVERRIFTAPDIISNRYNLVLVIKQALEEVNRVLSHLLDEQQYKNILKAEETKSDSEKADPAVIEIDKTKQFSDSKNYIDHSQLKTMDFYVTNEEYYFPTVLNEVNRCLLCNHKLEIDPFADTCIKCGICLDVCPKNCFDGISTQDKNKPSLSNNKSNGLPVSLINNHRNHKNDYFIQPQLVREEDCIKCYQCVRECPTDSIDLFFILQNDYATIRESRSTDPIFNP